MDLKEKEKAGAKRMPKSQADVHAVELPKL
jgi:hypothetical protein